MKWQNDHLEYDWFHRALPRNIELGQNVYIASSYIFAAFFSKLRPGLVMEEGSGAYHQTSIATGPGARIRVGAFTCLNSTSLAADESITIGSHCLFAWGTVVTDAIIPQKWDFERRRSAVLETTGDPQRRMRPMTDSQPVSIADNVWVGFDSVVMGGVSIGRGAIIGCKTVITKDIPPYAIVVGNPCRILRYLEPDDSPDVRVAALREFGIAPAVTTI